MKKLIYLFTGVFFLIGIEAMACGATFNCAGGQSIACTGDSTCTAGNGWVECTWSDGGSSFVNCPMW